MEATEIFVSIMEMIFSLPGIQISLLWTQVPTTPNQDLWIENPCSRSITDKEPQPRGAYNSVRSALVLNIKRAEVEEDTMT